MFHLSSINVQINFVPRCQKFLKHLLKSYHVHYRNNLNSNSLISDLSEKQSRPIDNNLNQKHNHE